MSNADDGWIPTDETLATSNVSHFAAGLGLPGFDDLLSRSLADPAWYWDEAVRYLGLPFSKPYKSVLDTSRGIAWARWFVGGETNVAAMCIDRWLASQPDATAVEWYGEDGNVRRWTWTQLDAESAGLARVLRDRGVRPGDRIALFVPMVPEAVAAFLAIARIGAVVVPLFSGFGVEAIQVRLADAGASVVVTTDGTLRRGNSVPMAETALAASVSVPSVHTVVVARRLGTPLADDPRIVAWPAPTSPPLTSATLAVASDHDLLLAYTSGTTGVPKGAVHCHGGLPVKIAAEGAFQHDLRPGERLLWFSDMGWIMGPYQIVASLANGATLCLIEGAPDFPRPDRLWEVVSNAQVTVLGLSPTLIRSLMPSGSEAVGRHDLSSLRILGSTGEPWNTTPWLWYFNVVGKRRCPIINMSGGTEVGGALLSPHPVQRIPPGSLVGPGLGMAVDVYDDFGRPVRGEVGELVCTKPWPGMTNGLFRDPHRYESTYWSRWPSVWVQGDWASVDADGFWYLHGRSDDTISVAGKRLGPAEPESVLVSHPSVVEAAAVGIPDPVKGEALMVFVVLSESAMPSPATASELTAHLAERLGSSFKPAFVAFVDVLPKTRSGKVMRRALRAIVTGDDPGDLSSMDDPSTLENLRSALMGSSVVSP